MPVGRGGRAEQRIQVQDMFADASPIERAVLLAVAVSGDPASSAHVAAMLTALLGSPDLEVGEALDTLCGRDQLRRCKGRYALHAGDREALLEVCQRTPIEVMGRRLTTAALRRVDCELLEASVPRPAELSSASQAEALTRAITGRLALGEFDRARNLLLATEDQLLLFGEVAFVADTAAKLLAGPSQSKWERYWIHIRAGDAKGLLGDPQAALACYDQARRIATDEQIASVDVMRTRFLIDLDRLDEAADELRRLGEDPRVNKPALASIYWHERASLARKLLRLNDALDCEWSALRMCEVDKEHGQCANLACAQMDVGLFVEAERLIRQSLAASSGTMNRLFHANQLAILSDALLGRGQLPAAEQHGRQALAARREIGVAGYIARSLLSLGWLLEVQDRGDEAAALYGEALAIQRGLDGGTAAFPASEISVALAAEDVAAAQAALSTCEATSPTSDRDRLLLGGLRLAQGDLAGAAEPFRQVVQQARMALTACARSTCAGRHLVVALCGLVAAGENHDVITEIDRFRSNIDSLGPMMELRHQLRMLHRYDRAGRTTPALDHCNALISRPADVDRCPVSPDPPVLVPRSVAQPMPSSFAFPPPLVEAYRQGKLAVLFGSGLSMAPDVVGAFPRWSELPGRFLDQAVTHGVWTPAQIDAKRAFFAGGHLSLENMLAELDALKAALRSVRRYRAALTAIFEPPGAVPGDVHRALVELGITVLVTTNFDELLEHVEGGPTRRVYTWLKASQALEDIQRSRKVLFKIHGTADDDSSVVMSRAEYDRAAAHVPYQRAMSLLLQSHVFLLVGYGINDPLDLDLVFGLNATVFDTAAPTHYALMKQPSATDRDRWQREMNIQVVPYDDHGQLPAILRALARTKVAPAPS